jgi:hypothetical protein
MKQLLNILTFIFISATAIGQSASLKVGDKWEFEHPHAYANGRSHGTYVFYDGLCAVYYEDKVGFIDSSKTIAIPLKFVKVKSANAQFYKFIDSRAIVAKGGKCGVIDTLGNTIIPFIYDGMEKYESYYFVYIDWKNGYIDSKGDVVVPIENEWPAAPYRTDEKIEKLIQKQKVQEQAKISKKQAIKIAKKRATIIMMHGRLLQ